MRIHEYALMKDVTATLARPRQPDSMWRAPPLVVMNNFAGRPELKLATALFQNLFPAINVQTAKLFTCQVGHKPRSQPPVCGACVCSRQTVAHFVAVPARVSAAFGCIQPGVLLSFDKETKSRSALTA